MTSDREIERELAQVQWAPRVNISAKTGRSVQKLVPALETALGSWDTRISTGRLNTFLKEVVAATPPPVRGGKQPRILFATQATARTADVRVVHHRLPGGRVSPVPGAAPARDIRVRGQPGPDQRAGAREARSEVSIGWPGARRRHDPDRVGGGRRRSHQHSRRIGHTRHVSDLGGAGIPAGDGDDVERGRTGGGRLLGHLGVPAGTARPVGPAALADPGDRSSAPASVRGCCCTCPRRCSPRSCRCCWSAR